MKDLFIVGAGGLAREIAALVGDINYAAPTWNILGFVERDDQPVGAQVGDYRVAVNEGGLRETSAAIAIGIGSPPTISRISTLLRDFPGLDFPNLIHPSVVMHLPRVTMSEGNIFCAGTVMTTDISLGSFNIVNLNCTVGHDARIGSACVLNPSVQVSGGVHLGDRVLVGTGATILENVQIGDGATIGAGAVVTKDVASGLTVVGVPARPHS